MNLPHWHLLLNHVPTVGFAGGVGLLILAILSRDEVLHRHSLRIIYLVALLSIPVYLTGLGAAQILQDRTGVSAVWLRIHGDAALLALLMMEITGAAAWVALWQFRRFGRALRGTVASVVLLSLVSFGLMGRVAYIGGGIRHPEVLDIGETVLPGVPVTETAWLTNGAVKAVALDTTWAWPANETVHFIGLALSFGIILVINLRVLGVMKSVAFADLHRMLPWGLLGFAANFLSGMMFFIAIPESYDLNTAFQWKIGLLVLAGVNLLYFTSADEVWQVGAGADAPLVAKTIAASTIFLWAGVVFFGRMLPYIGGSF
jgi:hypothetical protein